MRKYLHLLVGGVLVLLFAGVTMAGITSGTIIVKVVMDDGTPIKGAQVTAESKESISTRTARTSATGEAVLLALDPSNKYVVETIMVGFNGARNENVRVTTGATTNLTITLILSGITETVTVTAETPLVDVTSAISGTDITLEYTESLPTGRSYQSYLQLVPGVLPDDPSNPGNPASRSGLNYRDIGGDTGVSRDNFYYLEGIDVTDPVQGTFGANLNTEIILEQKVITGAIPAEFAGAAGLISNVVTKFGGNEFSGSVNYFFQNDSLVADNENAGDATFDTLDAALTIGGPILKDKLWFFASYRKFNREEDVTSLDTDMFLRTVENDQDQYYAKVTWQASNNDRISGTWLGDPTDISGQTNRDILNTRDEAREQGGDRYIANYQRVMGSGVINLSFGKHNGELTRLSAINASRNDNIFKGPLIDPMTLLEIAPGQMQTLADEQLGGFGTNIIDERDTEFYKLSTEWFVGSSWAQHTIKGGVEFTEHISFRDSNLINGEEFQSLNNDMLAFCTDPLNNCGGTFNGTSLDANFISTGSFSDSNFDVFNPSDFAGLITSIDASMDVLDIYAFMDTNADGTITPTEASLAMIFDSTAGNSEGLINYNRDLQTASGPQEVTSEGTIFYLQDTAQIGRWTVNLGVRAERWEHFATTGANIFTFDWEYAPRTSVVWDVRGDGKQKLSAYYGRYYDPIRNNMTQFAGTLTGRVTEEQVWLGDGGGAGGFTADRFMSFRTRGGAQVQDALFAPTTETPYTDEIEIGYQIDLGNNQSLEVTYISRETNDILEDYDLGLYALNTAGGTAYPDGFINPDGSFGGSILDPDSLFLGLDYFGYTVNPGSNFVIATLEGGKREWDGIEVVYRKRFSDNWQGIASYTHADATGNSNSDSNADFQGDVLYLDPRAPFQQGDQPGSISDLVKVAGSYAWGNGFKVGGAWRWNSGTIASRTELRFRRNLPIRRDVADPFTFAGIAAGNERWLQEGSVGTLENPSWNSLDIRTQYNHQWNKLTGEFFIDIFNIFDDQNTIRNNDLVAGTGLIAFGDAISWVPPRRIFLGARLSF